MSVPPADAGAEAYPSGRWETARRILALLGGAFLMWASFPPLEWYAVAWFAPLLWLVALEGLTVRERLRYAFAGGFLFAGGALYWFWPLFDALSPILWGVLALYLGAWGALTGLSAHFRGPGRIAWPAVAWVGIEYLRGEIAPLSFSWLSLGYSQINHLGMTLASVVGVYGVSFVLVFWGSCVLWCIRNLANTPKSRAAFVGLAAVPLAVFLQVDSWAGESLGKALLVQRSVMEDTESLTLSRANVAPSTSLIVFPEYSAYADPFIRDGAWVLDSMKENAALSKAGVLFGSIRYLGSDPSRHEFENTAFLLGRDGTLEASAVKNHPIPMTQDGRPAKSVTTMTIEGIRGAGVEGAPLVAGVGICFDGAFQQYARRMVHDGAEVLIFPTFNSDAWGLVQHLQHQRMFQMRAAETGKGLLVAAVEGPTIAIAPNGSVIRAYPFGEAGLMEAPIPRPGPTTPFSMLGWYIGPGALIALIIALGTILMRGAATSRA